MEEYNINILEEKDRDRYRQFLKNCKEAHYGHSLEIRDLIVSNFKFKPLYLIAKLKEEIVGALPLFEAQSIIEGKRLVSIPYFPFGGVIGESNECKKELLEKAKELSKQVKYLEIRQNYELEDSLMEGLVRQAPITDFFLNFKKTKEETFNSLDKRVRYDIRRAEKNNLQVKLGNEKKLLNDFYTVYLHTKKKRGVPAWPYDLFKEALVKCDTLVGIVYFEEKPIAGGFFFLEKKHKNIEYGFGGVNYKYNPLCPYYALLWKVIEYGIDQNYLKLEFGGTTKEINDGDLYAFKERWCDEKKDIPYYFYAQKEENIPQLKSSFKLYKIYGKIWSLLPKFIIKIISPIVMRQFK